MLYLHAGVVTLGPSTNQHGLGDCVQGCESGGGIRAALAHCLLDGGGEALGNARHLFNLGARGGG